MGSPVSASWEPAGRPQEVPGKRRDCLEVGDVGWKGLGAEEKGTVEPAGLQQVTQRRVLPRPEDWAAETMARFFSPPPPPSEDLFYETYYSLSQQYPLLLVLLAIVLCALVALLVVASASGRVRRACYPRPTATLLQTGGRVTA